MIRNRPLVFLRKNPAVLGMRNRMGEIRRIYLRDVRKFYSPDRPEPDH